MQNAIRLAAVLALSLPAAAQVAWTAPPQMPEGCRVPISVSNDTSVSHFVGECSPYQVRTAGGQLVFDQPCNPFVAIEVPPGEAVAFYWDQNDNFGSPVPPGDYVIFADEDPFTPLPLTIGAEATVAPIGVFRLGTKRSVELCSPKDPNLLSLLAASQSTAPGIPLCATTLPLNPDALFLLSLDPANAFPTAGFGTLDGDGVNGAATFGIPSNPNLAGFSFFTAFAVIDVGQLCPFVRASEALPVTIQP